MDKIIVGFSKPNKWKPFAWMIQTIYGIKYDHVYIQFYSAKFDRNLIYQASKLMVNFVERNRFLEDNVILKEFEIEITEENRTKMIQFAIDNVGKPYGILEAIGLGIVRIAEIFGKKIKNPLGDSGKTYVCSELAGYILKEYAGKDIPEDINEINPRDVYNYLNALESSQP